MQQRGAGLPLLTRVRRTQMSAGSACRRSQQTSKARLKMNWRGRKDRGGEYAATLPSNVFFAAIVREAKGGACLHGRCCLRGDRKPPMVD